MEKSKIRLSKAEAYSLQVKDLMDAVPTSTVIKCVDKIDKHRLIKWVVDGYAVHSSMRDVYSVGLNEIENFEFFLKLKDYKKFVEACEKRRAELYGQLKKRKR